VKIGIVSPYAYPRPGGANDHIRQTYIHLRKMGHDVRILTAPWGDDPPAQDVIQIGRAVAVPYNGSIGRVTMSIRLEELVRRVLDRERFDILHHHEPFVPFLSFQLIDSAACPHVATFHAFAGFSFGYWAGRLVLQRYFERLNGRICVSSAARHFISRYFPGEYRVIPNGVDTEFFARAEAFPEYRDDKVNILFVGRAEERKGLFYLADAYAMLKRRQPKTRLIIVGGGPEIGRVRRYLRQARVPDVLFAGRVDDHSKARFYRTADICCAPSTGQESFGIVLLEAMAAGRAIVASDIHGYKTVVRRDVSALLVEPKNSVALAAALERLIADRSLRARLGAAGQARAHDYTWDRVTKQVADYYAQILGRSRAPGSGRTLSVGTSPHQRRGADEPENDGGSDASVPLATGKDAGMSPAVLVMPAH
jgi:phosphatidylinositol alpha-mannosyltransferase